MKAPRSASEIGLQAVSRPFPKTRKGLPARTRPTWPESDLKKAVGLTMDQVRPDALRSVSKASFACWKARRGFCTQRAERSTNCAAPAVFAAASAVEWAA